MIQTKILRFFVAVLVLFLLVPCSRVVMAQTYTYPNPFDVKKYPYVAFVFRPSEDTPSIKVFNLIGETVATLANNYISGSSGRAVWDGKDGDGNLVASGMYFYMVKGSNFKIRGKLTILR